MALSDVNITLNIQNNTNYPQQINIMGNPSNLLDNSNATTEYAWDVTTFTFTNENKISILYRPTNNPRFQCFTFILPNQSIQAVVDALNTLGIGNFTSYVSGGNTYISTYNDNFVFSQLNIFNSNTPQLYYSWNTSGVGGNNEIKINLVSQVNDANPIVTDGFVGVVAGNIAAVNGTTDSLTTNLLVQDIVSNTILAQQVIPPSTLFNGGFAILSGRIFLIQVFN